MFRGNLPGYSVCDALSVSKNSKRMKKRVTINEVGEHIELANICLCAWYNTVDGTKILTGIRGIFMAKFSTPRNLKTVN